MARSLDDLIDNLKDLPDDLQKEANEAVSRGTDRMKFAAGANLASSQTVYHGDIIGTLDTEGVDNGGGSTTHYVYTTADHAPYIEFGTGSQNIGRTPRTQFKAPDGVPREKIREWIEFKGISSTEYDDSWGLAEAIATSIEQYGSEPHPFMRPAFVEVKPVMMQDIRNGIRQALRRV